MIILFIIIILDIFICLIDIHRIGQFDYYYLENVDLHHFILIISLFNMIVHDRLVLLRNIVMVDEVEFKDDLL